jgi:hypothetical protein
LVVPVGTMVDYMLSALLSATVQNLREYT